MPIKTWKYAWKLEFEQYFDQHFLKWRLLKSLLILPFGHLLCGAACSKRWSHPWLTEVQHNTEYTQLRKLDLTSTHLSRQKHPPQNERKKARKRRCGAHHRKENWSWFWLYLEGYFFFKPRLNQGILVHWTSLFQDSSCQKVYLNMNPK